MCLLLVKLFSKLRDLYEPQIHGRWPTCFKIGGTRCSASYWIPKPLKWSIVWYQRGCFQDVHEGHAIHSSKSRDYDSTTMVLQPYCLYLMRKTTRGECGVVRGEGCLLLMELSVALNVNLPVQEGDRNNRQRHSFSAVECYSEIICDNFFNSMWQSTDID